MVPARRWLVGSTQRRAFAPCSVCSCHAPAPLSGHRALGSCRVVPTQQGLSGFKCPVATRLEKRPVASG